MTDIELLSLGVPEDWMMRVRQIATEDYVAALQRTGIAVSFRERARRRRDGCDAQRAACSQWQALERVRGAHAPEAMPTVNFSVPQDLKQAFDAACAGQNKGAIMVELIDNALALLQATAQGSVQCLQPPHFLAELAAVQARLKRVTAQVECLAAGRIIFRCRACRYGLLALNSA